MSPLALRLYSWVFLLLEFVITMPIRLADIFKVPGSATVPVAPVGVSPTGLLSTNRIGMVITCESLAQYIAP
jgi:hypothetical protein